MRDGTFGVTSRVDPFEDALVEALESHRFDQVKTIQWRNRNLDFASVDCAQGEPRPAAGSTSLTKAPPSEDVTALDIAVRDESVRALADAHQRVALLWDICQVPDYSQDRTCQSRRAGRHPLQFHCPRGRSSPMSGSPARSPMPTAPTATSTRSPTASPTSAPGRSPPIGLTGFAIRRIGRNGTRAIEDRLSDALHERLTGRFIDRRTSVLMRRLKENAMLEAEITTTGDVLVEGQHVGQLDGFRFAPDPSADGPTARRSGSPPRKRLPARSPSAAERVATANNADLIVSNDGMLRLARFGDRAARRGRRSAEAAG